jgi:type IV pilus assembly protein PilN
MIKINLLPFRAAQKLENIRMQISVFALSVVLVLAIIGFSYISLSSELNDLRKKNAGLKKELASYSEMLKKIDKLKKKRDDLKGKLGVIQGLEAQKAGPVQLFDEIAMAVPEGKLFLKSLSESKGEIKMAGTAIDYDTVALFMTNLEKTKTIGTVTLGGTSRSDEDEQTVSSFTLTCKKKAKDKKEETGKEKRKKGGKSKKRQ